jgi:hypothetical protein
VEALWVLIVAAAVAAGYHAARLAMRLYSGSRFAGAGNDGGRSRSKAVAWISFLLDKVSCLTLEFSLSFLPENMAGNSRVPEKQGEETGVRDWPGAQLFPLMRAQWNCRELLLAGATGVRRF